MVPMQSKAATAAAYLATLPADRRAAISAVREVILQNLDKDCEEGIQYGMIGYYVPHRVYPAGYHCDPKQPLPFIGLASQKNHMAVYMMCTYGSPQDKQWLADQFAKAGKKFDMGTSCIRFKKLEDLHLPAIGQVVKRMPAAKYIKRYEAVLAAEGKPRKASAKAPSKPARAPKSKPKARKAAAR
jgi:hypothetical protein